MLACTMTSLLVTLFNQVNLHGKGIWIITSVTLSFAFFLLMRSCCSFEDFFFFRFVL
ncbi:hypothetical protein BDV29DRAFT_125118 [Aspergillus leporis]|uniref:Uncharacterized protein n=1 Tax=Aspergillus leporis TaxID=41062 RepID=A0A5N5X0D8_9EURO|nr:hypothetical protein BDV29DRAFT_125118 [Aspergillus leporis]